MVSPAHAETTNEECILENMPGVKNKLAAVSVIRLCKKYPQAPQGLNASNWFGPKSGPECVLKYGKNESLQISAAMIYRACNKLYGPELDFRNFIDNVCLTF